ncbi:MAG: hypothetical protein ACOCS7_02840 [Halolamina sp.]
MGRRVTRRTVLRTGGTLASIGATSLLAGCQADLLRRGDGSPTPAVDAVERWSPAPFEVADVFGRPSTPYTVKYVDHAAVVAANDRVTGTVLDDVERRFEARFQVLDVQYGAVVYSLTFEFCQVLQCDHDPAALGSRLESAGYGWVGQHRGFEIYAAGVTNGAVVFGDGDESNRHRIFGFDGTSLVHARHGGWSIGTAKRTIKLVVDAHLGEAARVTEDSYAAALLSTALPGDVLRLERTREREASDANPALGRFEGTVGTCTSNRFASDAIQHQRLYPFADASTIDLDAIETYVAILDGNEGTQGGRNVAVDRQGRLVEITFEVPLESFGADPSRE